MHGHKILTERTGVHIYFTDLHSTWQRGSNENTNGLLRQYLLKGLVMSIYFPGRARCHRSVAQYAPESAV